MQSAKRFCTQCGTPLAPEARFCGACGSPVRLPESEAVTGGPAADNQPNGGASDGGAPAQTPRDASPVAPPPAPRPVARPPFLAPAASRPQVATPPAPPPAWEGTHESTAPAPAAPPAAAGEPIVSLFAGLQRKSGFLGLGMASFIMMITRTRVAFIHVDTKTMNAFVTEARLNAKSEGKGWLGQSAAQMGWVSLMLERLQSLGPDAALAQYEGSFFIPVHSISRVQVKQLRTDYDQPEERIRLTFHTTAGKQVFSMIPGTNVRDLKQRLQRALGTIVN